MPKRDGGVPQNEGRGKGQRERGIDRFGVHLKQKTENRTRKKTENYLKITLEHIEERGIQAAYGDRVEGATLRGVRRPKLVGRVF